MMESLEAGLADAREAMSAGADLVEFRIDPAMDVDVRTGIALAQRAVEESPAACIITCRHAREGGEFEGDDADRIALIEAVCEGSKPPAYVDVEFAMWRANPEVQRRISAAIAGTDGATGMILSAHDFAGRPTNLFGMVRDMQGVAEARVLKIAYRARSVRDNIEVEELVTLAARPMIALAMGEAGVASRVLAGKWGAFLTFASVREAAATAPGQMTVRELIEDYRFRSIGAATRVFGVIGWPVAHSIGWRVHNAMFGAMGFDGVYMRFPVAPEWESFKATVVSMLADHRFGLGGASVTLPHKEHLLRLAREDDSRVWEIDPIAALVGAANSLVVRADGSCWVGNTDVAGVVEPITGALGSAVRGKRVAVLGAGGAARAAAIGLAMEGAMVTVFARRVERAEAIAGDARGAGGTVEAGAWAGIAAWEGDAVINCTPMGMMGTPDAARSPVEESVLGRWGSGMVVMDTVYRPVETPLVVAARGAGCGVVIGTAMYSVQAAGQIRAWVGQEPPLALLAQIVGKALASTAGG